MQSETKMYLLNYKDILHIVSITLDAFKDDMESIATKKYSVEEIAMLSIVSSVSLLKDIKSYIKDKEAVKEDIKK